ncbi:MAG: transcriptional repressor [Sulfurimonas sp.]|jgi:Fe2+ or Zn2+ uptake regulation protein|nr:transcriptional repressor [Sulfurimonas sp.]
MSLKKLYECIEKKRANHSRAREAIYNVLMLSDECLNICDIVEKLSETYPKKISLNTLYRHLNFFIECKLIVAIQDDFKRAYYHLREGSPMAFCVCTKCTNVSKINLADFIDVISVEDVEFITFHKKCKNCID